MAKKEIYDDEIILDDDMLVRALNYYYEPPDGLPARHKFIYIGDGVTLEITNKVKLTQTELIDVTEKKNEKKAINESNSPKHG